jgi:serine/threonine protein kinase
LCDIVGDANDLSNSSSMNAPCLVFEWMDSTLAEVAFAKHKRNYALHHAIIKSTLLGLRAVVAEGLVHTDLKPANILITGEDCGNPVVKLADLDVGMTSAYPCNCIATNEGTAVAVNSGYSESRMQPYAMRAPEVWQGLGCSPASDIWALAVTLFDWIKPHVFGISDKKPELWPEEWAMAKLMRIFPDWSVSKLTKDTYQSEYNLAAKILIAQDVDDPSKPYLDAKSLDEYLSEMDIYPELGDFLRYLFVLNPSKRPSAEEALASEELRRIEALASHSGRCNE